MSYAHVNGTRLYYEMAGSGHPLALVHGFSLDYRMWDGQFDVFARRYRVIRYDARGFGRSALPVAGEVYYHAADLMSLLNHLEIQQAHLVGLSMGGAIALEFALAYPAATGRLVAADAAVWGYRLSPDTLEGLDRVRQTAMADGVEAARSLWLAGPLFEPALRNAAVGARLRQIIQDYSGWHWTQDDPGRLPEPPAAGRLTEIAAPTLALCGELDLPDFLAMSAAIAGQVPGAREVRLPGAGHLSNMEDPAAFNRAVLEFLAAE